MELGKGHRTVARLLFVCSLLFGCVGARNREELRSSSPEPPDFIAKGDENLSKGESLRAEQYYALAWQRGENKDQVLPRLLDVCLAGGRLRSALEYVEHGLREDPRDLPLRQLRLTLLLALGHIEDAVGEAHALTREEGVSPDVFFLRATLEAGPLNKPDEACKSFQEYLKRDPAGRYRSTALSYLLRHAAPAQEGGGA